MSSRRSLNRGGQGGGQTYIGKGVYQRFVLGVSEFRKLCSTANEHSNQEGREGRVLVQFVINRDGSVVEAKVVNSVYSDLDEEALWVVNSMPKWKLGKHKGEFVRVKFTLPINFKIPNKK